MLSLLMLIINAVTPVFLVVALGVLLRRLSVLGDASTSSLYRFVFVAAAPCLLFVSAARVGAAQSPAMWSVVAVIIGSILVSAIAYGISYGQAAGRRGVIAQGAFRSNMVFLGLPIAAGAFGEEILGVLAVPVGMSVIVYNVTATFALLLPHATRNSWLSRSTLVSLLKDSLLNPLVLGSLGGLAWSRSGLPLPAVLDRTLDFVGASAMPLALVALGSSLQYRVIRSELVPALWVSAAKLLVHPALVWLLLRWWGVDPLVEQGMLVCMATPAAVAGHVMAVQMRGDTQLSAAVVMVTTALSAVTLPLWLAVVLAW